MCEIENIDYYFDNPEQIEEADSEVDPEALALFLEEADRDKPPILNKVMVPSELDGDSGYTGKIYGYIREDSGYHCIIGWENKLPAPALMADVIGFIGESEDYPTPFIQGVSSEIGLTFCLVTGENEVIPLEKDVYTEKQDIFSRNSGLLETGWLDDKLVFISGCGSVGSQVALQLARSGVGRFILCDTDCMEIHNVCRHQCSLKDIGRYKVDAVEERILQINPNAEITKFYMRIQDVPRDRYNHLIVPRKTVFVGTCDNRVGDAAACDIAYSYGSPFLALGFMTRAWAGEIFICLPERHDICYGCAFKTQIDNIRKAERRNHFYVGQEDLQKAHFEPGLDVDLEFGVSLFDKVVLDVLNRFNKKYKLRIAHKMSQYVVFSGTADRTYSNAFWDEHLPEPVSMMNISFTEDCRRCDFCIREKDE